MSEEAESRQSIIQRNEGVTASERYLDKLCRRTFLSLWSYPRIHRDQYGGKEICDLLVVFENHIIIFSDKDCKFPDTGNVDVDWQRWYRKAVKSGADQVYGAERWIKEHPDRLFLDHTCEQPFPLEIPDSKNVIFHRIVVAHGASKRCKKLLGGSGALAINTSLVGNDHLKSIADGGSPFAIGFIDREKGYVHILDDTTLDIVLQTLDTVTDFLEYLTSKELLISKIPVYAAGEEELLGLYLYSLGDTGQHGFAFPDDLGAVSVAEGFWQQFKNSEQRKAQLEANQISYLFDAFIEHFNKHLAEDTRYRFPEGTLELASFEQAEKIHRFLARESRTRRRMLSQTLLELASVPPTGYWVRRVLFPSEPDDPTYVFLFIPSDEYMSVSYDEYREMRARLLYGCCLAARLKFPFIKDIVGIAMQTGILIEGSEDLLYVDARKWDKELQKEAKRYQREFNLFENPKFHHSVEYDFPVDVERKNRPVLRQNEKVARNARCPYNSGKKFKHCCAKAKR